MFTARTTVIAIAVLLATVPSPGERLPKQLEPSPVMTVVSEPTVDADSPELHELGVWALGRFGIAGLAVPPVTIALHDDPSECGGHRGTFNPGAERIDVCVAEPRVVLHEIAHAWAHATLTEDVRQAYVDHHGFRSWNAPGTPWLDRGSEHAADTIAWGLTEGSITLPTPDGPLAKANDSFRMLTGSNAPIVVNP